VQYILTERDGRKGQPAGNKTKCNGTNTPHSKATRRKAKPNQKPQTHTRGERQALTISAEGLAKGNAKLPKRPRDEGGPREARPASLHGLVGQGPEQRQGWGPKAPEGLDRHQHEGQGDTYTCMDMRSVTCLVPCRVGAIAHAVQLQLRSARDCTDALIDCLPVHISSMASPFCFSVMKPAFRREHVTFGCVEAHVPGADEQHACLGHNNNAKGNLCAYIPRHTFLDSAFTLLGAAGRPVCLVVSLPAAAESGRAAVQLCA
jgi:hypothetical protein